LADALAEYHQIKSSNGHQLCLGDSQVEHSCPTGDALMEHYEISSSTHLELCLGGFQLLGQLMDACRCPAVVPLALFTLWIWE